MSDGITERLKVAAERGQALQQIADDPLAPVSGLSPIELAILAVAAGEGDGPGAGFSLWSVRNDAEKAGLSKMAISLAIRRLTVKQFLEEAMVHDGDHPPYKGARITDRGWELDRCKRRQLCSSPPASGKSSSSPADD